MIPGLRNPTCPLLSQIPSARSVSARLGSELLALGEGQRPQEAWDAAVKAAQAESKLPEALKTALTPGWAAEKFGMTSIRLLQAIEVGARSRVSDRGF